jgi:hypothetical protein
MYIHFVPKFQRTKPSGIPISPQGRDQNIENPCHYDETPDFWTPKNYGEKQNGVNNDSCDDVI